MNLTMMGLPIILGIILAVLAVAGFVLFIMVLYKLNKALNIWLNKNR